MQDHQNRLRREGMTDEELNVHQDQHNMTMMQKLSQLRTEAFYIISCLLQIKNQITQMQQMPFIQNMDSFKQFNDMAGNLPMFEMK